MSCTLMIPGTALERRYAACWTSIPSDLSSAELRRVSIRVSVRVSVRVRVRVTYG